MSKLKIAIVGATGNVGRKIIEVLIERKVDADYTLFASEASQSEEFIIFSAKLVVKKLSEEAIAKGKFDYAFFAVEADIAVKFAPIFAFYGTKVIDNSNAFRRKKGVALAAPVVNSEVLKSGGNIVSNPNCSTIQLVTALNLLSKKFGLKRVVVSTYQAVSGAGQGGIDDLRNSTNNKFDYPICNNLIPQIDVFLPNRYSREEDKLIFETRKILSLPSLPITATAVRVPILNCHSESVNVEFEKKVTLKQIVATLRETPNVVLLDDPENKIYPMPIVANGKDEVFVGRLRKDYSRQNCFNMFVVADNLRRGAASNAVDIFLKLEEMKKSK